MRTRRRGVGGKDVNRYAAAAAHRIARAAAQAERDILRDIFGPLGSWRALDAWKWGAGLVVDRTGKLPGGLSSCGSRRAQQRQDRGDHHVHAAHS